MRRSSRRCFARRPQLKSSHDAETTAEALQSAWRAYHRGDFGAAVAAGFGARADRRQPRQQGGQHLRDLSRDATSEAQARDLLASAAARRGAAGRRARLSQRLLFPRPGARPLRPGSLDRQGAGGGNRRQGEGEPRQGDRASSPSTPRRTSRSAPITPRSSARSAACWRSLTYGASKDEAVKHIALARKLLPESADRPDRGGERPRHAVRQVEARRGGGALQEGRELRRALDAMQKLDAEHAREEADG